MSALILYDTTGPYGWLGELYAIMTANLASRFGTWTAAPVSQYTAGQIAGYTATIYIGSTYGEPIPNAFLDDVLNATNPVIWLNCNIWQLTSRLSSNTFVFRNTYGWVWSGFDTSTVAEIDYKGQKLKRNPTNQAGIMNYALLTDSGAPNVLATAVRADGTTFPWALRAASGAAANLTYVGEMPFVYLSQGDRYLAFCDLLFDALAPTAPTTRRALLRLEDISPQEDPTPLYAIADYLAGLKIPFGFQIVPSYTDPTGYFNHGTPLSILLKDTPKMLDAMAYMQAQGGELLAHGYTHQYSNVDNPYSGVSGADAEFFRLTLNPDLSVKYVGPVPQDSIKGWTEGRITSLFIDLKEGFIQPAFRHSSYNLMRRGGRPTLPLVWTSPSYVASAADYQIFSQMFRARAESTIYYAGLLNPPVDPTRFVGQYAPYIIHDVYGGKVLPDTLGGVLPAQFGAVAPRMPADVIADAQRNLVVRDAWASFYFHAYDWDTTNQYLQTTVQGILNLGYTFVPFSS